MIYIEIKEGRKKRVGGKDDYAFHDCQTDRKQPDCGILRSDWPYSYSPESSFPKWFGISRTNNYTAKYAYANDAQQKT